jgi:guanylate kinase
MREADLFLESAEVFGNLYGTGVEETERHLAAGEDLVLVIDVQGARTLRDRGVQATSVFVLPPSYEVLEQRLRDRKKDSEEQVRTRLRVASQEVSAFPEYDYVVVNDDLDCAVGRLQTILLAERLRLNCMRAVAERIAATFSGEVGK